MNAPETIRDIRKMVAPEYREAFWVWLSRKLYRAKNTTTQAIAGGHPTYTAAAVEAEMSRLRDAGKIACTNGKWWPR